MSTTQTSNGPSGIRRFHVGQRPGSKLRSLLLAGVVIPVWFSQSWAADTLFANGKIFTANRAAPTAEAVGIRDDRIIAVGTIEDVQKQLEVGFDRIDLKGNMLLPGLIDSHSHPVFAGFAELAAELPYDVTTVNGLAAFARTAMDSGLGMIGDTLRVGSVSSAFWDDTDALDKVFNSPPFADVPVILAGGDYHTGWGNTKLLQKAGVDKDYIASLPDSERVLFGVRADGSPNGFGAEGGWDKLLGSVPPVSDEMLLASARMAISTMNSFGITAFVDAVANHKPASPVFSYHPKPTDFGVLSTYRTLSRANDLTAHVTGMVRLHPDSGPADLSIFEAIAKEFKDVKDLKIGGIKMMADGILEFPAQTASMSKPYKNSGKSFPSVLGTQSFRDLVAEADKRGILVHSHVIGDLAVTHVLDAIEGARSANGNSGIQHTLAHLQVVHPNDYERFGRLGINASMTLLWAGAYDWTLDMVAPYIDEELAKNQYPARSLRDGGATISGGSDYPVSSPNPFLSMKTAIDRLGDKGVLNASQALTAEDMLYAYTINSAEAASRSQEIGSIEPGKSADFVLVDRDILSSTAEEIGQTKVLWTMFGGKKIYEAPSGTN